MDFGRERFGNPLAGPDDERGLTLRTFPLIERRRCVPDFCSPALSLAPSGVGFWPRDSDPGLPDLLFAALNLGAECFAEVEPLLLGRDDFLRLGMR